MQLYHSVQENGLIRAQTFEADSDGLETLVIVNMNNNSWNKQGRDLISFYAKADYNGLPHLKGLTGLKKDSTHAQVFGVFHLHPVIGPLDFNFKIQRNPLS
jgi:hypothetical protein